ncbi:MAG: hypothetical protein PSV35_09140 [bacterium]|nr:hypothetical protein [bacterium]
MSQLTSDNLPICSTNECYEVLAEYGVRALRFKKLPNETMYHQEISFMAKACVMLLINHTETPHSIINHMQTGIINLCNEELTNITAEIQSLFNQRKKLSPDNAHGEQQITKLTIKINELEKRKNIPTDQMIQNIIYDTLKVAGKNTGIDIPDEFQLHSSEYNTTQPTPMSLALKEALITLEKNI